MDWNELSIQWTDDAPVYLQLANYFSAKISRYRQFRRLCRQQKKAEIRNVIKFQISRLV